MQKFLKNTIPYLLAMLIIGSLVFVLLYYVFGLNRPDSIYYAVLAATVELVVKSLYRLYNRVTKKKTGQAG